MMLNMLALAGLFNMLSDSSHEIRQQADQALSEFLQEIKNAPVSAYLDAISNILSTKFAHQ